MMMAIMMMDGNADSDYSIYDHGSDDGDSDNSDEHDNSDDHGDDDDNRLPHLFRIKSQALKIYRKELDLPSSKDLGLHGTSRAALRTLCKTGI